MTQTEIKPGDKFNTSFVITDDGNGTEKGQIQVVKVSPFFIFYTRPGFTGSIQLREGVKNVAKYLSNGTWKKLEKL